MNSRRLCSLVSMLAFSMLPLLACEKSTPEPGSSGSSKPQQTAAPSAAAATPAAVTPTPPEPEKPKGLPAPDDVAAPPADAKKTASGLAIKVLTPGKGKEHPGPNDKVTVHYTGWTTDGKMFDSSIPRGEPTSFRVSGVIKGWTEGLQLMTTGEKARLWIPGSLAYGDAPGQPGMPTGMLVFDVELIDFTVAPKPPTVPPDVKAAPPGSKKTESGLSYRVLQKGKGTRHPAATDRVKVHYSGWTTDGKMFDSSVTRGEPATFALNRVIKGWTEGVQLMVEGEKTRFWIPAELAYGNNPGSGGPSGQLTFDIELLEIQ
jgi:peptidylprolyl isomerase